METALLDLAETQPARFLQHADGTWLSPAGEAYAMPLGLSYHVHSSAALQWTYIRNFREVTRDQVASYYPDAMAWIDRLIALLIPPEDTAPFVRFSLGFAYIVPNTPDQIRQASAVLLNDFNDAIHRWDLAHRVTVAPALGATGADVSSIFTDEDAITNARVEGDE